MAKKLTATEQWIADLAKQGFNCRAIAAQLNLKYNTVRSHLSSIRKKTDFPTLLEIRRSPELHQEFGYRIGSLCRRGHRYNDLNQSLRNEQGMCVECDRISNSGTYYRKKQRQQQKAG